MINTTVFYSFGNPFKVIFRKHYCYKCGELLSIRKHIKLVHSDSLEAKYYDFRDGEPGRGMGRFIHKVFYCSRCKECFEFITQLNLEDIDIFIKQTERYYAKRGAIISIKRYFETEDGTEVEKIKALARISNLCLLVKKNEEESFLCRVPITRTDMWEQPYYFDISKKALMRFIESPDTYCEWKVKTKNKRKKIYKCLGIINLCLPFILIACALASTFIFGKQCSIEGNWFFLVATLPWLIAFMFFDMGSD